MLGRIGTMSSRSDQIYFKLCSDHLSLEAIPKARIRVNFSKLKDSPPEHYVIVMWTPHFAVVRNQGGQEITLRGDGRMLIRKAESEAIAREAASEMMSLVLKNFER
jgi:hypothetical protein